MKNLFIYFSIAIIGLGAVYTAKSAAAAKPTKTSIQSPYGDRKIGGPFTLVDYNGRTVTEADFKGRYLLVFFGYTFCPDVCPTALSTFSIALDLLGEDAKKIAPLFISVDAKRDTPEILKEYVKHFNPQIIGLTGTNKQISAAAKAYGAYYAREKTDTPDDKYYLVNHTAYVYLMGPDGNLLDLFGYQSSPEDIASKIKEFL